MQSKVEKIQEIQTYTIYQLLEDDFKRIQKEYKGVTTLGQRIPMTEERQLMSMCIELTNDIQKAGELYDEMDIVELYENYTLKIAMNYNNPFMEKRNG